MIFIKAVFHFKFNVQYTRDRMQMIEIENLRFLNSRSHCFLPHALQIRVSLVFIFRLLAI